MYKDFSAPLTNAYNFFATYAKIDNFRAYDSQLFYIVDKADINDVSTEKLMRMNIDTIISLDKKSPLAGKIHTLIKSLQDRNVHVEEVVDTKDPKWYEKIIQKYTT